MMPTLRREIGADRRQTRPGHAKPTPAGIVPGTRVGVAWFEPEDYAPVRAILDEHDNLPASFKVWRKRAATVLTILRQNGYDVAQIRVTATDLAVWCHERNVRPTFLACIDFAEARAKQTAMAR